MTVVLALHITFYSVVYSAADPSFRNVNLQYYQSSGLPYIYNMFIFSNCIRSKSMLLMSLLHLLDPLQVTRRIKLTSQNLKVIETRIIPDGTPPTYKKSVEEETMGCNTGEGG